MNKPAADSRHDAPSPIRVSVVIPTRNRCATLANTLTRLSALNDSAFEVIVIDNASTDDTHQLAARFTKFCWQFESQNIGAAARNVGVELACGDVILMLDDDSWPAPGVIDQLAHAFARDEALGAVVCRVLMADDPSRHDAGGAAGAIVNCGGAVRRAAFRAVGGYPVAFDYYVEEYDLCCKLLAASWRVQMAGDLVVYHQRTNQNRKPAAILQKLVRNNIVLWTQHAPPARRELLIDMDVERYQRIAKQADVINAFNSGLREGVQRAAALPAIQPLTDSQFAQLFQLDRARQLLRTWADTHQIKTIAFWSRGKGCELLIEAAISAGVRPIAVYDSLLAEEEKTASNTWRGIALHHAANHFDIAVDGIVLGTLSPGVASNLADELAVMALGCPVLNPVPWANLLDEPDVEPSIMQHSPSAAVIRAPQRVCPKPAHTDATKDTFAVH